MIVQRVETETGSHIEPPLDQTWDEPTMLEWQAAVVRCDTGLDVRVHTVTGGYNVEIVGHSSVSTFDYRRAWTYLTGVSCGFSAAWQRNPLAALQATCVKALEVLGERCGRDAT